LRLSNAGEGPVFRAFVVSEHRNFWQIDPMAVRPILRMGEPLLLQRAAEVSDPCASWVRELLLDMHDTMRAAGGAGLAAPQIGVSARIVIFGFTASPRYPDALPVPQTVLINPVLTPLDEAMEEGFEGCLSVPGMRGVVPRYTRLRYQGVDENGASIDRSVEGFHARVVQHEVDHLDGVLYPMRIRDFSKFGFEDVLFAQSSTSTSD
jgi:peptide deformylase